MKIKFYFLFFILVSLGSISADITPSTTQLNFDNVVVGIQTCKTLSVSADTDNTILKIHDVWAQDYSSDSLTFSAADSGIQISYPNEILFTEAGTEIFDVCVTASEAGKYKGKFKFEVERQGEEGIGSQLVVQPWIRLYVSDSKDEEVQDEQEKVEQTPPTIPDSSSSQSGASSSSGGTPTQITTANNTINIVDHSSNEGENNEVPLRELEDEASEQTSSGITGGVIGVAKTGKGILAIAAIIFLFAGLIIYKRKFTKR